MRRRSPRIATITSKRQLTIPTDVARKLSLQRGDKLAFSSPEEGVILATPLKGEANRRIQRLREIKRRVRGGIGDDELIELITEFLGAGEVEENETT